MGGSESKSEFQALVRELPERDLSTEGIQYWKTILRSPTGIYDIFACVDNDLLKNILGKHPVNFLVMLNAGRTILSEANSEVLSDPNLLVNTVRFILRIMNFLLEHAEFRERLWEDGLGFDLVQGLMGLVTLQGFALEYTENTQQPQLWAPGLLSATTEPVSEETTTNRLELMRCLLTCYTGTLYRSIDEVKDYSNPWALATVNQRVPNVKTAFYSWLNLAIGYNYEGYLPFSGFFGESELSHSLACQLLVVLLDNRAPLVDCKDSELNIALEHLAPPENLFITEVLEMSPGHFEFILTNIARLLYGFVNKKNSYLPSSVRTIEYHQELLILFWHLVDLNSEFLKFACESQQSLEILESLLHTISEDIEETGKMGLVQLAILLIFRLSSNREFSVKLVQKPPYSSTGNYYDLLLNTLKLPLLRPNYKPLYPTLLHISFNVSPFAKTMNRLGSQSLFSVFEQFSSESFLAAAPANYKLLQLLLDAVTNRFQYQWDGSLELAYIFLSKRQVFERLLSGSPSEELARWRETLPLSAVALMYKDLFPRLEDTNEYAYEQEFLSFLAGTTLVGALPPPPMIVLRTYKATSETVTWLTSYTWGTIFTRNQSYSLFNLAAIKLFTLAINNS